MVRKNQNRYEWKMPLELVFLGRALMVYEIMVGYSHPKKYWRTGFLVHCNSMGLVLQRETSSKTEAETDSILSYPTPEA